MYREIDMSTELEDKIMVFTNRLWALAQEQESKGNAAMHYVLDDICDGIKDAISDEMHKDD
jgi:hypothetical protein